MKRNQMVAILLMGILLVIWSMYFGPQTVPVEQQDQPVASDTPLDRGQSQPRASRFSEQSEDSAPSGQWPAIPPVPEQTEPADDEVIIAEGDLELVFTRIGGRLKRASLILGEEGVNSVQLVPQAEGLLDTEAVYPLGLHFSDPSIGDRLDIRRFDAVVRQDRRSVTFSIELPGAAIVRKTFTLTDRAHLIEVDIEYQNLESQSRLLGMDIEPAYILNWAPALAGDDSGRYFKPSFQWREVNAAENEYVVEGDLPEIGESPENRRLPNIQWMGYRTKYFLAALKPAADDAISDGWLNGSQGDFRFGLNTPRFEVAPGAVERSSYELYLGPMQLASLREAWPTLPSALRFFNYPDFMDTFSKLLLRNLNWWYQFVPNYGIAIILLTLMVRVVVLPLSLKSMRSMKAMQSLGPEMEELKEKHKDDQQELSKAMMELYRERGVNPMSGCWPMLIQMPVFFALYRMIWYAFEIRGAQFLWMEDLSQPDRLFHLPFMTSVPLLGGFLEYFNLLPILMVIAMVVSMKMTPSAGMQNPQQKMMMTIMPVFFGVVSWAFSAGLNLYVLTSTVLGILQNQFARTRDVPAPAPKKPKKSMAEIQKKRKQHFYTRAQERKRQQAKSARKQRSKGKSKH